MVDVVSKLALLIDGFSRYSVATALVVLIVGYLLLGNEGRERDEPKSGGEMRSLPEKNQRGSNLRMKNQCRPLSSSTDSENRPPTPTVTKRKRYRRSVFLEIENPMEGYLHKATLPADVNAHERAGAWRKRYFTLGERYLLYHKTRDLARGKAKLLAALDLRQIDKVTWSTIYLELVYRDRRVKFRAPNAGIASQWYRALTKQRDAAKACSQDFAIPTTLPLSDDDTSPARDPKRLSVSDFYKYASYFDFDGSGWSPVASLRDSGAFRVWRKRVEGSTAYEYHMWGRYDIDPALFCRAAILDLEYKKQWDAQIGDCEVLSSSKDGKSEIVYWQVLFPWPFQSRDYVYSRSQVAFFFSFSASSR